MWWPHGVVSLPTLAAKSYALRPLPSQKARQQMVRCSTAPPSGLSTVPDAALQRCRESLTRQVALSANLVVPQGLILPAGLERSRRYPLVQSSLRWKGVPVLGHTRNVYLDGAAASNVR